MKQLQVTLFILSLFAQAIQAQPGKQTDLLDLSSTKISEISTNKVWSDFGPAIIGNDLYYTSFKDAIPGKSSKSKDMSFYDLFKVKTDSSGMTTSSREFIPESETRFHEGPISWCEKTGEMFYTQSNYVDPAVKYKAFRNGSKQDGKFCSLAKFISSGFEKTFHIRKTETQHGFCKLEFSCSDICTSLIGLAKLIIVEGFYFLMAYSALKKPVLKGSNFDHYIVAGSKIAVEVEGFPVGFAQKCSAVGNDGRATAFHKVVLITKGECKF